mmetsp:Transcript_25856/g.86035  ORF Transcript_25856/g.86035 Transcript_25856/m.86035 type:complete len:231 (+) Transcript_25856:2821-3513(+)
MDATDVKSSAFRTSTEPPAMAQASSPKGPGRLPHKRSAQMTTLALRPKSKHLGLAPWSVMLFAQRRPLCERTYSHAAAPQAMDATAVSATLHVRAAFTPKSAATGRFVSCQQVDAPLPLEDIGGTTDHTFTSCVVAVEKAKVSGAKEMWATPERQTAEASRSPWGHDQSTRWSPSLLSESGKLTDKRKVFSACLDHETSFVPRAWPRSGFTDKSRTLKTRICVLKGRGPS